MKASDFFERAALTAKSVVKMCLQSRGCSLPGCDDPGKPLIVMGNGPSLAGVIAGDMDVLHSYPTLAVNFAANTPQFFEIRPRHYLLADPLFFNAVPAANVDTLWSALARVDWPMTLFVPSGNGKAVAAKLPGVDVREFNFVGLGGFHWFENLVWGRRLGMPRPRNVLIPSIMAGIWMGYREIYIVGADHSWTKTLEVADDNTVVSVQPHFYEDNKAEHSRVTALYKNIRLHELLLSFHVAFKSYFSVRRFADRLGVRIYNSTPGSFIDAFERRGLPEAKD